MGFAPGALVKPEARSLCQPTTSLPWFTSLVLGRPAGVNQYLAGASGAATSRAGVVWLEATYNPVLDEGKRQGDADHQVRRGRHRAGRGGGDHTAALVRRSGA